MLLLIAAMVAWAAAADEADNSRFADWANKSLSGAESTSFSGKTQEGERCVLTLSRAQSKIFYLSLALGDGALSDRYIGGYLPLDLQLNLKTTSNEIEYQTQGAYTSRDSAGNRIQLPNVTRNIKIELNDRGLVTRAEGTMSVDPKNVICEIQN